MALALPIEDLQVAFGDRLTLDAPLAPHTTAKVGGPAAALIRARSAGELAHTAAWLWHRELPVIILGGGSNVLVADGGVDAVVVLNEAKIIRFQAEAKEPSVWAESGATFSLVGRMAAQQGLAGLEWAGSVPGTVGGAVFGNAGAFGGDVARDLRLAEILHPIEGRVTWPVSKLEYGYRTSRLKRAKPVLGQPAPVILAAEFRLTPGDPVEIQAQMAANAGQRRASQPPGASMGSMFKNPPGDYAGRLIEACGLKGRQVGGAEISSVHANFFVNKGQARAAEVAELIGLARAAVLQQFGVALELEIEPLGFSPDL